MEIGSEKEPRMTCTLIRKLLIPAALLTALLGNMPVAIGQTDTEAGGGEQASEPTRPPEQITVLGQRSLRQLRMRIEDKQAEIFDYFNANNSSDRFDILCDRRRITGSHIRIRECEPRFLKNLRVDRTRQYRMGINTNPGHRELVELAAEDYAHLQAEMQRLMRDHPPFAEDLAGLAVLQQEFESAQAALSGAGDQGEP